MSDRVHVKDALTVLDVIEGDCPNCGYGMPGPHDLSCTLLAAVAAALATRSKGALEVVTPPRDEGHTCAMCGGEVPTNGPYVWVGGRSYHARCAQDIRSGAPFSDSSDKEVHERIDALVRAVDHCIIAIQCVDADRGATYVPSFAPLKTAKEHLERARRKARP